MQNHVDVIRLQKLMRLRRATTLQRHEKLAANLHLQAMLRHKIQNQIRASVLRHIDAMVPDIDKGNPFLAAERLKVVEDSLL